MKRKHGAFQFKAMDSAGKGTAVFATMNVIDKDGDYTLPGAFGNQIAKLVGAHDWAAPSIGIAKVREEGNEAIADFEFNLEMEQAAEWYKSLKFNFDKGIPQEFSYGFDILEESPQVASEVGARRGLKKLKVHEVSPVMIGAGNGTRLLGMKSADLRMEDHGIAVVSSVHEFLERLEELGAKRRSEGKSGRVLSRANRERLTSLQSSLGSVTAEIERLLLEADKNPEPPAEDEGGKSNNYLLEIKRLESEARFRGRTA